MDILKTNGLLRLPQIIGDKKRGIPPIIPVCKSSWWKGVSDGRYPKPIKLGTKTTVWSCSSIAALVEKLKAGDELDSGAENK